MALSFQTKGWRAPDSSITSLHSCPTGVTDMRLVHSTFALPAQLAERPLDSRCLGTERAAKPGHHLWTVSTTVRRPVRLLPIHRADYRFYFGSSDPGDAARAPCSVAVPFWPKRELAYWSRARLSSAGRRTSRGHQCPQWARTVRVADFGRLFPTVSHGDPTDVVPCGYDRVAVLSDGGRRCT